MTSPKKLARIDSLAWTTIYGGLFVVVLGIVTGGVHVMAGWSLGVVGVISMATGIVLIVVRSRLPEAPAGEAQSSSASQGQP